MTDRHFLRVCEQSRYRLIRKRAKRGAEGVSQPRHRGDVRVRIALEIGRRAPVARGVESARWLGIQPRLADAAVALTLTTTLPLPHPDTVAGRLPRPSDEGEVAAGGQACFAGKLERLPRILVCIQINDALPPCCCAVHVW